MKNMSPMKLFAILLFNESRKVGFGLWLFLVTIYFFFDGKLDAEKFVQCVLLSWSMIGGGTIADAYLKKGPSDVQP